MAGIGILIAALFPNLLEPKQSRNLQRGPKAAIPQQREPDICSQHRNKIRRTRLVKVRDELVMTITMEIVEIVIIAQP